MECKKKVKKMSKITKYSDHVTKPRLASKGDLDVLTAKGDAQDARNLKVIRYARPEIYRIEEVSKAYPDKGFIARCEAKKREVVGNDKEFEADAQNFINTLMVEAALNCRIDMNNRVARGDRAETAVVDFRAKTRYLTFIFETMYGKVK